MHTQRRYATCPQGMSKKMMKREKMHTQKGMPHAHKACQKKKKKGEEEEENIAHTKKQYIQEREIMQRSSSTIHQKYPHTCTS